MRMVRRRSEVVTQKGIPPHLPRISAGTSRGKPTSRMHFATTKQKLKRHTELYFKNSVVSGPLRGQGKANENP
jgi:hypothetical protein